MSRVIVVGAGIAGLKAAETLCANGVVDVTVLEARDRCGGRLCTVTGFDGVRKYDVGASWHHDTLCNGLFDEEVRVGEENGAAPFVFDDDFNIYLDKDRGRVDRDPTLRLEFIDREVEKFSDMLYHQRIDIDDMSFHDLIMKYLFERQNFLSDDQLQLTPQICRFLELWHGLDWTQLSAKDTYFGHQGRNALVLNFDTLVQRLETTFPAHWLHLNTQVTNISRVGNEVHVTTHDGMKHIADYVICTIPQSVLKLSLVDSNQHPLPIGRIQFDPPLNSNIVNGFNSIHYGSLGKIIFEFQSTTWKANSTKIVTLAQSSRKFVNLIRNSSNLPQLLHDLKQTYSNQKMECWNHPFYFINLPEINGTPSLMMLMQEPVTTYIESLKDNKDQIFQFFQPILNKIMSTFHSDSIINAMGQDSNFTHVDNHAILKNIITSNWSSDPFARGSYTACKPGDDGYDMILSMIQGQDSRIRFAGEHTILDGAGCVYGAWESGDREAKYIINRT